MINKDNLHISTEAQFIAGIGVLKVLVESPKVWTFAPVGPQITQSVIFYIWLIAGNRKRVYVDNQITALPWLHSHGSERPEGW